MLTISSYATTLLTFGIAIHLFCDWILQNDWMARNKATYIEAKREDNFLLLTPHPAAWVHAGIHFVGLLLIFQWWVALIIAATHLIIDLRFPLVWWRKFYRQTTEGPVALHVALWGDQVCHITVLAIVAFIVGR